MMFMVDEHIGLHKKRYNIQEVADILGVYRGTIKNYEKKGKFILLSAVTMP